MITFERISIEKQFFISSFIQILQTIVTHLIDIYNKGQDAIVEIVSATCVN